MAGGPVVEVANAVTVYVCDAADGVKRKRPQTDVSVNALVFVVNAVARRPISVDPSNRETPVMASKALLGV